MATHDYIISNASGAAVRADLNNALAAIASNNSSATEPTTTYAYQWWADTGSSPTVMKLRNAANSGWVTLFQLDGEWTVVPFENGTAAAPSIYFKDSGTDTGLFSGGTDQVNISTGGTERVEWGTSEVVFNDGGNNYDFRVEGDTNANLLFVDASADAVGIGTTSPLTPLVVSNAGANGYEFDPSGGFISAYNRSTSAYTKQTFRGSAYTFNLNNLTDAVNIDSSGRLLVGTSSSRNVGSSVPLLAQIESTSGNYPGLAITQNGADTGAGYLFFGKSRGTSNGSSTVVADGDRLGSIRFAGADGTDLESLGAQIEAFVDGTPGANDMPGRIVLATTADGASSPTERMRITQQGDVLISNTNRATQGRLCVDGITGTQPAISCFQNATTSQEQISFRNPNGVVGNITTNGSNTAYNQSSDYRLKENITAVSDGITRLQQLKPSRFNFIADPDCIVDGFIAHEVQAVVPEAVTGEKDAVDSDGNPKYQGIDQSKLVPLLTAALQEAIAKIETLEAKVAALEAN